MGRWFGPSDSWPQHDRAFWRPALREARGRGWWLQTFDHDYGRLYCEEGNLDACQIRVDGTASGAEPHAIAAIDKIRACPHRMLTDEAEEELSRGDVEYLLMEADALLKAAESLLRAQRSKSQADELLSAIEDNVQRAEQLMDEAILLEDEATFASEVAANSLTMIGENPALERSEAVDFAESRVDQVETEAREEYVDAFKVRGLRDRIAKARTMIARQQIL